MLQHRAHEATRGQVQRQAELQLVQGAVGIEVAQCPDHVELVRRDLVRVRVRVKAGVGGQG